MSGIKRKIEGNDPDYDDISLFQNSKRNKAAEHNGKCVFRSLRRYICFSYIIVIRDFFKRVFLLFCQPEKQQYRRLRPSSGSSFLWR